MGSILDDSERLFFDCIAGEVNNLSGSEVNFYGQSLSTTKYDPLYNEPSKRSYAGPIRMMAYVRWPQVNPFAGEQGFGFEFDGEAVIARTEFEKAHTAYPFEGDILEFWRTPYHDADSLGRGLFFDIIKVQNDGHVNDSASFVQFRLTLKRRSDFAGERKLDL